MFFASPTFRQGFLLGISSVFMIMLPQRANADTFTCNRTTNDHYTSCSPSNIVNFVLSYVEFGCWTCNSNFSVKQAGSSRIEVTAATWQDAEAECRKNPPKYEQKKYRVSEACTYNPGVGGSSRHDGDCAYKESTYSCVCRKKVDGILLTSIEGSDFEPDLRIQSLSGGFTGREASEDGDLPGFGSNTFCLAPSNSSTDSTNIVALSTELFPLQDATSDRTTELLVSESLAPQSSQSPNSLSLTPPDLHSLDFSTFDFFSPAPAPLPNPPQYIDIDERERGTEFIPSPKFKSASVTLTNDSDVPAFIDAYNRAAARTEPAIWSSSMSIGSTSTFPLTEAMTEKDVNLRVQEQGIPNDANCTTTISRSVRGVNNCNRFVCFEVKVTCDRVLIPPVTPAPTPPTPSDPATNDPPTRGDGPTQAAEG